MYCNFEQQQKKHEKVISNDNKSGFVTAAAACNIRCNNWCRQSRSSRTIKRCEVCEHESNEAQALLHCIRLQSNVRQFRSISRNLFKQFKSECCCYCIRNDVPQNITSSLLEYGNLTSLLRERCIEYICFIITRFFFFLSCFYFSFSIKGTNSEYDLLPFGWVLCSTQCEYVWAIWKKKKHEENGEVKKRKKIIASHTWNLWYFMWTVAHG